MYHILLVEDDAHIREVISDFFSEKSNHSIELDMAGNGDDGMDLICQREYDLVMLDVMLPGIDGFAICRAIRRHSGVPIIFITARGREEDKLFGYQLGCDDYIVKPFSLAELYAKTQALLKRSKGLVCSDVICVGDITLNPSSMCVTVAGREIELCSKEYYILKLLMENPNVVIDREQLILRLWGYDFEGNERVLDNHMKKLRKALGTSGKQIKTVYGKGYRLNT
jgi:DNA-binding response OmpR family regulator